MKNEARTDLWVYELSKEANIKLDALGCKVEDLFETVKDDEDN